MWKIKSVTMEREQAVDTLMSGIYVRRVFPRGDNTVYLTLGHDLDNQRTLCQDILSGERLWLSWDDLEFLEDPND